ncbi:MAG TPA: MATE family efflux transporter [Caulobacteraceae bacterium]
MTASVDADLRGTEGWVSAPGALAAIGRLAAPLTAFFAMQSATNLACTAFLGRLGVATLAGVGAASTIYGVVIALMFGADAAVQAIVSRRSGAGRKDLLGQVLTDALAITLPLGAAVAMGLWLAAPTLVPALVSDRAAAAIGIAWLRAAAPSVLLLGLTVPINACWIGQGRPAITFAVSAILAPLQVAATYALAFGAGPVPALGGPGAGLAITLACAAGACLQLALVARPGAIPGFLRTRPRLGGAGAVIGLAWPISLQQALLQVGFIVAYLIVARLGVATIAATNVLITLATVPAQLAVGIGVASATLVGQTLGRGDIASARHWGWRAVAVGLICSAPFTLAALLATRPLLGLFLHDPTALSIAVWPVRIVGLSIAAQTTVQVLSFSLRGAGATRLSAGIAFVSQWLAQLPLSWWVAVTLGFGLVGLACVQCLVVVAEAAVTVLVWAGARWTVHRTLSKPVTGA